MESFKIQQLRKNLDVVCGNSPQAKEFKEMIIKAHLGVSEEEIEQYKKQKEQDVKDILEYFGDIPEHQQIPCETIYGELKSNTILDDTERNKEGK
jgi:hypothetical protein